MRVYVGSITHETNRFSPFATRLDDYGHGAIGYEDLVGEAVAAGCQVVPGLCARAAPSGPTLQADFETLRERLVAEIAAAGALDLVLLSLHGAQVAEGHEDCEGDIAAAVRDLVGEQVIIGVLLDLHASISPALLRHATMVTVIKEYPHTDFPETARQLVDLCLRCARGEVTPVTAFVPLPLFSLWHTPQQPCKALVERAREVERDGEVLHVSLVHGFPWSDVADAGAAVLVTTDGDANKAIELADLFASSLWSIRDSDLGHYRGVTAGLDAASTAARAGKPAVIADAADNPGAGTGSDATWILQEVLARDLDDVALALFWDPAALAAIVAAGEGARLELQLGGHTGSLAGKPVLAEAQVTCINDNAMIDTMPGYPAHRAGTLAAVSLGGVQVVVGAYREQVFGPRVFTEVCIDPTRQRLLVVKSAQHFYKAFAPLASAIIYCDSPCSRTIEFSRLPFARRRQPIWPLEPCSSKDIPKPMVFSGPGPT